MSAASLEQYRSQYEASRQLLDESGMKWVEALLQEAEALAAENKRLRAALLKQAKPGTMSSKLRDALYE